MKKNLIALLFVVLSATMLTSCFGTKTPERFYFGSYSEAEKLYNQGEYKEAIKQYEAYIEENPGGNLAVISKYYIAKSHAALGNKGQAKTLYEEIKNNYKDLVWAKFADTQLQELALNESN